MSRYKETESGVVKLIYVVSNGVWLDVMVSVLCSMSVGYYSAVRDLGVLISR